MIKKAGLLKRVRIRQGPAPKVLPRLTGHFDCILIDVEKDEYPRYFRHAMRLSRTGGRMILAGNLLWGGSVLGGTKKSGSWHTGIHSNDVQRLRSLIVPLGDGLGVSYRVK